LHFKQGSISSKTNTDRRSNNGSKQEDRLK
jgi:hypothetical protein